MDRMRSPWGLRLACAGVLGLAAVGCRSADDLAGRLDAASVERLAAVPPGASVLLSLRGEAPLGELPELGEGGRTLGRRGATVLVEAARDALPHLAAAPGVVETVIWGSGEAAARLEVGLRNEVLEMLDDPARRGESLAMIATFASAAQDARASVEGLGGRPRSLTGDVMTLDASIDEAFAILALPELVKLARPAVMRPVGDE